jgi:hypothetical protein
MANTIKVGSQVRYHRGYGADTFEVVAATVKGAYVGLRALQSTATHGKGETLIALAADLSTVRAAS